MPARKTAVDIFSGSGRLAACLRQRGWHAIEWDIKGDGQYDLTKPRNVKRLISVVAAADYVHLAVPCNSFSTARRGHPGAPRGPLRTNSSPFGLPGLSDRDFDKVLVGNFFVKLRVKSFVSVCLNLSLSL